jgi:hypothetical protein
MHAPGPATVRDEIEARLAATRDLTGRLAELLATTQPSAASG